MNITILKNKNYLLNNYIINKYKFVYIESEFSEEVLYLIYNYFGILWTYTNITTFEKRVTYLYKDQEDFKQQFEIKKFNNNLEAEKYLKNNGVNSLENKYVLELNRYQIFWHLNFIKQYSMQKKLRDVGIEPTT